MAYRYPTDTPTDTQPAHIEARGPAAPQSVHLDWQPRKYVHMNECKYVRLFVCVCRYMHVYVYMYIRTYMSSYTYMLCMYMRSSDFIRRPQVDASIEV